MLRRTAIKSIVLAALGVVGLRKKPKLFVVETPDGTPCGGNIGKTGKWNYRNNKGNITFVNFPDGTWKLARIVFEKVENHPK